MLAEQLQIAGLEKTSLIEYPGELCAVVFLQGCNFRCPFCHNAQLVRTPGLGGAVAPFIPRDEFADFLDRRRRVLDAVTVTGGEPTIHERLPEFLAWIKQYGYRVKLDTNGARPAMLANLIKDRLVDYVAMDIKSSPVRYSEAAGSPVDLVAIEESVRILIDGPINYEFRSTLLPRLHDEEAVDDMALFVSGARQYYLQTFRPVATLDPSYAREQAFTRQQMLDMAMLAKRHVLRCDVR